MNDHEKAAIKNAISSNDLNSLSQLLLDNKGPACCGWALGFAIRQGCNIESFVNFLVKQGADVNVEFDQGADLTVFGYACRHLSADIVKVMLDNEADLFLNNKFGLAPIHQIFNSGDAKKIDLLSKMDVDSDVINQLHLLHYSVKSKSPADIVRKFLKLGADVNSKDQSGIAVLYQAVRYESSPEIIKILVENGADINGVWKYGQTAIKLAVQQGSKYIVETLLSCIASSVDGLGDDQTTLIEDAVHFGREEICKLLWERGARRDDSLLGMAYNHPQVVNLLLDNGCDPNHLHESKTMLCHFIEKGKTESVKLLLNYGARVNDRGYKGGMYPLHCAIERVDSEIVKLLLDRGANVKVEYQGQTPLKLLIKISQDSFTTISSAEWEKREEIVKLLLKKRAKQDSDIVQLAIQHNRPKLVKLLLERGFRPDSNIAGSTALTLAIKEGGRKEIVTLLLNSGARVNNKIYKNGKSLLHCAIDSGDEEIVRLLIDRGARQDDEILLSAIKYRSRSMVKILLDRGFDVNSMLKGKTTLDLAITNGKKDIVKLLLDYGAQVDGRSKDGKSALHCAIDSGDEEIVRLLIDRGARQDDKILQSAIKYRSRSMVKILLDQGFDVNCMLVGKTTLDLAITNGKKDIVKLLLDYGAQVDGRSMDGKCALHCAAENGDVETVRLLLDRGASISAKSGGQTALQMTIKAGSRCYLQSATGNWKDREEIVKLLLDRGAMTKSKQDDDVLHAAIRKNILIVVKLLLDRGFDVNCTFAGQTALMLAVNEGYNEIVKLLLEYGAQVDGRTPVDGNPLHRAIEKNDVKIFLLLFHHGADIDAEFGGHTALTLAISLQRKSLMDFLTKHIVLKQSQGFNVSKVHLNAMKSRRSLVKLQDRCTLEIGLLKSQKFDDSSFSYIDVLKIKDNCGLAALANNNNIVRVFESIDFIREYPIYGKMIVDCINKAILKKKDFDLIKRFIAYLSTRDHDQLPQLPFTVAKKIFSYLHDKDIATFRIL